MFLGQSLRGSGCGNSRCVNGSDAIKDISICYDGYRKDDTTTLSPDSAEMRLEPSRTLNRFYPRWRACLLLLVALILATPAAVSAQKIRSESGSDRIAAPDQSPIRVGNLARDRYVDRQRATLEMWRRRPLSRQAVQDAAQNSDPEVVERAEWILKQWRSGALPGVGTAPEKLLLDRGSPSALASVLEQGAFNAVLIAVEESAGTIGFDQIKRRVARSLTERYPMYADKAFANGTELDLLKLVDAVAVDRNFATAAHDLMKYLQIEIDDSNRLPSSASVWSQADQDICRSQFAMLRGDQDLSIELARKTGDPVLLRIAQMLAGRWDQIADNAFGNAEQAGSVAEKIEAYAWGLAAASRLDDQAKIDEATLQLVESPLAPTFGAQANRDTDLRWRALALHNQVGHAIDLLAMIDQSRAANLATLLSRFATAEKLCEFDLEMIPTELDDWISDAYAVQSKLPAGTLAPPVQRLYSLARLLLSVGETGDALKIYQGLTDRELIVSKYGVRLHEQTLNELELTSRLDWMREMAVAPGDNSMTRRTRRIVSVALGTEEAAFQAVLDRIGVIHQRSKFRQRFQMTFELFRGKLIAPFDASKDFRRLFEALVHHRQIQRIGGRVRGFDKNLMNQEIIDMFLRNRQVDLAHEGLTILAQSGNVDAMISVAERELDQGDRHAAAQRWKQVSLEAGKFTATEAITTLDHGLAYAKSVVGQWILAKRTGDRELAEQLEYRIRFMLTSPSLTFRNEIANYLSKMKQYDLAAETLRDLTVLASFGGDEAPNFFAVALAYVQVLENLKDSDPALLDSLMIPADDAVRWNDLLVIGILENTDYQDRAFVSVPLSVRKTFLQHAIDTDDASLAEKSIAQIESYDPMNIDFGERLLPKLRKAGMTDLADLALERLMDFGEEHIERFGSDATALNNLAWTAAMNQLQLDRALELSQRAVMLEPDSVVYRDTLAEVLHLLGHNDQALAIESACLLDDPDDWHLYQQIEKYQELLGEVTANQ